MPESISGLTAYFGGTAAVTEGALATDGTIVAGTAAEGSAGELAVGTAATAGGAGATQAGVGSTLLASAGKAAAGAAASGLIQAATAPKRPDLPPPIAMPDPQAQEAARQKAIADQIARRGRASTILTDSGGSGTLGG